MVVIVMKNNRVLLLVILGVLLILTMGIGISYSLWSQTHTQTTANSMATGCFSTTFAEENNISLSNQFPIDDSASSTLTPYTFTVTNNCSILSSYQINMEVFPNTTAPLDYVKVSLENYNRDKLSWFLNVDPTISNDDEAYKLKIGYLAPGESITYKLRIWIDSEATTDNMANKIFSSKIVVLTSAAPTPIKYYAFGLPTTSSSTNYQDVIASNNINVFAKLEGNEPSVCIYRNSILSCFKSDSYSESSTNMQSVFGTENCNIFDYYTNCQDTSFDCTARDSYIWCNDDVTKMQCSIGASYGVSCKPIEYVN